MIGLLRGRGHRLVVQEVYHRDPEKLIEFERLARRCTLRVGQEEPGQVVATQTPKLIEALNPPESSRDGQASCYQELVARMSPGSYLCVPLSVGALPLGYLELGCSCESGRRLGRHELALVQDLAERAALALQNAKLFEELQRALHAKDEWLTVASHELKTPLTPLQVLLQLMARRLRRSETIPPDHVDRCLLQVNKLTNLINDLLDVSRLEVGQLDLSIERFDLAEAVASVAAQFRGMSERHTIMTETPDAPLIVRADRNRIEQVLVNLVHNAIKFSPEGGLIRITLTAKTEFGTPGAVMSVEDEGIGIPEEDIPKLFRRYFRGSNMSGRNFGGLGLGLWLSNEIAVRHHGRLEARSTLGEGSTFSFWLPLDEPKEADSSHPLVLLVADDDPELDAIARHLTTRGFEVARACNSHAAMTVLSERKAQVVLLDVMLPLLDVWQLMREIKRLPHRHAVKVILTGTNRDLYARSHELGAWGYLPRPFEAAALEAMVTKALEP